jgi:hypothetical protein
MLLVHVDVERRRRQQEKDRGGHRWDGAAQVGGAPAEEADERRAADDDRGRDTDADLQRGNTSLSAADVIASIEGRA